MMTQTVSTPPQLTPETLRACFRQGCYACDHCSRISRIGQFHDGDTTIACEHCKHRTLRWLPPVLDEHAN